MNLEKSKFPIIYSLLALTTLAAFWPVHNFEFVNFDDHVYVTDNPYVCAGLTKIGALWAFTAEKASNWHPLTWLSHMLDCQLFDTNPGLHHVTSLLFHIANTLLLFAVLCQMTRAVWQNAFVAAVFALHPLHVESVAWVSERKDVLSTFFWILTMWAYLRYTMRPNIWRYIPVLLLFTLGLMAKPMLVTLPFVLLLLDYWPLERFEKKTFRQLIFEKIPLFVLSAASCIATVIAQHKGGALESTEAIQLKFRAANAFVAYAKYLQKTFWPSRLAFFYPHPGPDIQPLPVIISLLLLLFICLFIIFRFRTNKYLLVGWLWYLATLVPVIGFVQVGAQSMADRYTYVPLIGISIIIAWGTADLLKKYRYHQHAIAVSAIAVLLALSLCARRQVNYWRDSVSLFEHALNVTEKNYAAHSCLAYVLFEQGNIVQAIEHNRHAIAFNPNYFDSQFNLGGIFLRQGNLAEALRQFHIALEIRPECIKTRRNIAKILVMQNKPAEAVPHYEYILNIQPLDYDAHNGLAIALARTENFEQAIEHFNRAIEIAPNIAEAFNNLGFTLVRQGKFDQAAQHLARAIQLEPSNPKTHYQFARALAEKGSLNEAVIHLKEAIRLDPNYIEPVDKLVLFLTANKDAEFFDPNEAVRIASQACGISKWQKPDMLDTLASAYFAAGQHEQAIKTAEKALKLANEKANTKLAAKIQQNLNSFRNNSKNRK